MCLLEAGASPNCTDRKGLNSLHLAVVSNYTDCLRALLTLGRSPVDLNAMNYEGEILLCSDSVTLDLVSYYCATQFLFLLTFHVEIRVIFLP